MNTTRYQNISHTARVVRIAAGFGLIGYVFAQSGTVGLTALVPLIAVYPILTGFLGWEPLRRRGGHEGKSRTRINTVQVHHA